MSDVQYLDPEQFNNVNEKLDFKFILMRQIDKVRVARSTEMRGGYWEEKPMSVGGGHGSFQVYIPDTRETYVNSVKNLQMLLIPYWDEEYKKQEKKNNDFFSELFDEKKKKYVEAYKKNNPNEPINFEHFNNWVENTYQIEKYDIVFQILLKLCQRAKLIGGSNLITDNV